MWGLTRAGSGSPRALSLDNAASDGHATSGMPHVPHLLDFHDLRRPERLAFWAAMAACSGIGFLPRRQHAEVA